MNYHIFTFYLFLSRSCQRFIAHVVIRIILRFVFILGEIWACFLQPYQFWWQRFLIFSIVRIFLESLKNRFLMIICSILEWIEGHFYLLHAPSSSHLDIHVLFLKVSLFGSFKWIFCLLIDHSIWRFRVVSMHKYQAL